MAHIMEGNIDLSYPDELGLIFTSKNCICFILKEKKSGQLIFDFYHEQLNFQSDVSDPSQCDHKYRQEGELFT